MVITVHSKPGNASRTLIAAVIAGDDDAVGKLLKAGEADVNYADPATGFTALHIAAAQNAKAILKLLVSTGRCDFSIKDKKGRTPAVIAYVLGENPVFGRYLFAKQYAQGHADRPAGAPSQATTKKTG